MDPSVFCLVDVEAEAASDDWTTVDERSLPVLVLGSTSPLMPEANASPARFLDTN